MQKIVIDFETYYSTDYSLSKMPTDAYVLDPRFEVICVAVKVGASPVVCFSGTHADTANWLAQFPWDDALVIAHNTLFDGFILTQVFGIKPKMWGDTLGMSRALYPWWSQHSLASVTTHLGLAAKGTAVKSALGKRLADFSSVALRDYMDYCKNDTQLASDAFDIMAPNFPAMEFRLVDLNIRMFTEPTLQLDLPQLEQYHADVVAHKAALIAAASTNKAILMSNQKFAEQLEALGVRPPMKISKTTGKPAFAFAKSDAAFTDLLEHDDPDVQALVAARLGVKTTLAETRAMRFVETAQRGIGWPVYYHYWGARNTGRFSGGNSINATNLPSRGKDRVLRNCIQAPPGHVLVVGDSSNIELRVNLCQSGQTDLLDLVRQYDAQGDAAVSDLYCDFASEIFGRTVAKTDHHERTVGKVGELSLGYGAGTETLQNMLRVQAKIDLSLPECQRIVDAYRMLHKKVVKQWRYCNDTVLPAINNGQSLLGVDVNGWVLTTDDGFAIPGHCGVVYNNLHRDPGGEWHYRSGRGAAKIYGGKVVENFCQHVARHIVMWQMARFAQRYKVVMHTYDEFVSCVPEPEAQDCAAYMLDCLRMAPPWTGGLLPLNGEVGIAARYGDAK